MAKRVVTVANLLTQTLGDEAVILNLNTEKYYTLNGVGVRMWQVLTGGVPVDEAINILCEEYDVDRDVLDQDLQKFVQYLRDLGLVEVHET